MFKKLYNKFFNKKEEQQSYGTKEYGHIKFILYSDQEGGRVLCESYIKEFSDETVERFAEILFLMQIGALTDISIESLLLIDNRDFVNDILNLFQQEINNIKEDPLQPIISPSQCLRHKNDEEKP